MAKNKLSPWEIAERGVLLRDIIFSNPVMLGASWLVANLAQSQPIISANGWLGIGILALLGYILFLLIARLQPKKSRSKTPPAQLSAFTKILQWRWSKWIVAVGFFVTALFFVDSRPKLNHADGVWNLKVPLATYSELQKTNLIAKGVVLNALPRDAMVVRGKRFEKCQIFGPAVVTVAPNKPFTIQACSFALPQGYDHETVLLETKSGGAYSGVIAFEDVHFIQCDFVGVSFAGPSNLLEKIRAGIRP